jgi:GDP-mannose 6-dehydrogenase
VQRILALKRREVGFFGLSFKAHTDDLRESPIVSLVEQLVGKGLRVRIYDENLAPERLLGSNLGYVQEHLPHFLSLLAHDAQELAEKSELIVLCHRTPAAAAFLQGLPPDRHVLDLARVMHPVRTRARYEGVSW